MVIQILEEGLVTVITKEVQSVQRLAAWFECDSSFCSQRAEGTVSGSLRD